MQDQQDQSMTDDQVITNDPADVSPIPDTSSSEDTTSAQPAQEVAGDAQKPKPPKITWI